MNEQDRRPNLVVVLFAMFAIVGAVMLWGSQRDHDDPNYAPALLLLGVGAFLILILVIQSAGHRDG